MDKITCTNCGADNATNSKYCKQCGHQLPVQITATVNEPIAPELPEKKKLNWKTILGLIAGIAAMYTVQHFFFAVPTFDKAMVQFASEINKNCPMMLDKETQLDNSIALPDNVFQYNYTLVNLEKSMVDTVTLKNNLEPQVANFVRTTPQMKLQRDHKLTINYCYKDKNRQYLFMISITPDKYQ